MSSTLPTPRFDLKQETQILLDQALQSYFSEEILRPMNEWIQALQTLCEKSDQQAHSLLNKLFKEIQLSRSRIWIPIKGALLSVHEILQLMDLGFKLGKVDKDFEVKLRDQQRTPYYQGRPIPSEQWDQQFPCILKHAAYSRLVALQPG
ncbi:hypothetical protein WDW89_18920 [Deltaproteobacteria bacterium TL4]